MSCREPFALALALATAGGASAHVLDALEGTAVVRADRVEVAIGVHPGAEVATLAQLALHDDAGRPLAGRIVSIEPSGTVHLEYELDRAPRWLSFRMMPEAWSPSRARRMTLAVRDERSSEARIVTLTNGGNVETLRFPDLPPDRACGAAVLDARADGGLAALWRPDARGGRLDVVMSLGVLETWLPVPRVDDDVLSAAEQRDSQASVLDLVASRIRVVEENGETSAPSSREIAFLGLDDAATDGPHDARPLDAWTARVRVSLRFDRPGSLAWDLWNARVTAARVTVLDANGCAERRLSTYEPKL
jgi:hypothetical protein